MVGAELTVGKATAAAAAAAGAGGVIAPLTSQTGNLIKCDTED